MKVSDGGLPGVLILDPQVFGDDRGRFIETCNHQRYQGAGLDVEFVQDNVSSS